MSATAWRPSVGDKVQCLPGMGNGTVVTVFHNHQMAGVKMDGGGGALLSLNDLSPLPQSTEPVVELPTCVHCEQPIKGTMIGAGDGSGSKFAHTECYYRKEADRLTTENAALREKLEEEKGSFPNKLMMWIVKFIEKHGWTPHPESIGWWGHPEYPEQGNHVGYMFALEFMGEQFTRLKQELKHASELEQNERAIRVSFESELKGLEQELTRLRSQFRWTPISERLPTEKDAVEVPDYRGRPMLAVRYCFGSVNGRSVAVGLWNEPIKGSTHWQHLSPLPDPSTPRASIIACKRIVSDICRTNRGHIVAGAEATESLMDAYRKLLSAWPIGKDAKFEFALTVSYDKTERQADRERSDKALGICGLCDKPKPCNCLMELESDATSPPETEEQAMRREFEVWALSGHANEFDLRRGSTGAYALSDTAIAWLAYQAAKQSTGGRA